MVNVVFCLIFFSPSPKQRLEHAVGGESSHRSTGRWAVFLLQRSSIHISPTDSPLIMFALRRALVSSGGTIRSTATVARAFSTQTDATPAQAAYQSNKHNKQETTRVKRRGRKSEWEGGVHFLFHQLPFTNSTSLPCLSVTEWVERAKKELKTIPIESLDWHTAEVWRHDRQGEQDKNYLYSYLLVFSSIPFSF